MTVHIKLYGGKGDRFEAIKAELGERLGYEPTNPEVIGALMAAFGTDEPQPAPAVDLLPG